MNLLVKKIGLVFLPALFFACEEPTELGADLNPNSGALSTHYVELPVSTAQVRFDSLNSTLRLIAEQTFFSPSLGRLENEAFGIVKALVYANLAAPNDSTFSLGSQASLDSAKINVVWNQGGLYGKGFDQTQRFYVHRLVNQIPVTARVVSDGIEYLRYQYTTASKQEIGDQIGELSLNLADVANNLDTALLKDVSRRTLSLKLPTGEEDFASRMFMDFRNDPLLLKTQVAFEDYFKGIALVPADENSYMLSLDLGNVVSGLTLYYTQGTQQYTLHLPFVPAARPKRRYSNSYPAYTGLEVDRTGTGLVSAASVGHLQEFQPLDSRIYFQSLTGTLPKIEFNSFKEFMLSHGVDEQVVLNRAVIEFDSVQAGEGRYQPLPQEPQLYFVDDANRTFAAVSPVLRNGVERASSTNIKAYKVEETVVTYYQSDITFNLEQFIKTGQDRFLQTLLYPGEGQVFAPNSFAIRQNQVKLKIWYTKLKGSNL